jgi:hypothetical protein
MKTFHVIQPDQNRVVPFSEGGFKKMCNHSHKSEGAARRCLKRLSRTYSDGSHNEWKHYGEVVSHHVGLGYFRIED